MRWFRRQRYSVWQVSTGSAVMTHRGLSRREAFEIAAYKNSLLKVLMVLAHRINQPPRRSRCGT